MPHDNLNALRNERTRMINQKVYITISVDVCMPFYVVISISTLLTL